MEDKIQQQTKRIKEIEWDRDLWRAEWQQQQDDLKALAESHRVVERDARRAQGLLAQAARNMGKGFKWLGMAATVAVVLPLIH